MKKKLLFFDIDGTLIECLLGIYEIPKTVQNALHSLQEKGHQTFLATGRCKCFIVDDVMSYPFDGYVTCNGGYAEYQGKEVFKAVVPLVALEATKAFCEAHDMVYYFENSEHIYTLRKDHPLHIQFKKDWKMKEETIVDGFNIKDIEVYIGMVVVNSLDEISLMKETLSPYFDIQAHHSGNSFDLTLKGISKAVGIEKLVEAMHLDMEDTIAFGDGHNDLEMLQTVEVGVAMGNACKEAKEVSDYVTDRIEEEGIVKALEHFSLL
jgi:Cof subfamily protein (haloacid dehalogenase superfamily)